MAEEVAAEARGRGLFTTLTLATAFGCPFEGEVPAGRVVELARRGAAAGFDELCLGRHRRRRHAQPGPGADGRVREAVGEAPPLRYHFHNTRNTGFANAFAAVLDGVTVLDASAGGIGGCPFAPKATGNIATDDLVYMLDRMGFPTGLDLQALLPTAAFLTEQLGHQVPAMLPRAGPFP